LDGTALYGSVAIVVGNGGLLAPTCSPTPTVEGLTDHNIILKSTSNGNRELLLTFNDASLLLTKHTKSSYAPLQSREANLSMANLAVPWALRLP
jgi:hypothetical protein